MPYRARSLRFKLVAWFALVFFLIQTTLFAAVVYFRRGMITSSLDSALTSSAEAMIDNILADEIPVDSEAVHALVPKGANFEFYVIRDEAGEVLASNGIPEDIDWPLTDREKVPAGPLGGVNSMLGPKLAEELTGSTERLRMITLPFRSKEQSYYFQAAARDQVLERLLGPFMDLVVIGVPIGVLAAILAAWLIAGRAVAPIQKLSKAARDVSPRRMSERFEVETTDREVEGLESELNQALERLENGYRAQDQFISNVSHELRTPVAVLLTHAQVAKMGDRSLDKGYAFVDKAEGLLKRLGKVVESFLVLARSELTEHPTTDSVSLVDLVLSCLHSCKDLADQNQVRLTSSFPDSEDGSDRELQGDADLLQTMIENLVRNAISHSPAGSDVALDVEYTHDEVRILVRDAGPGIPEDYIDRIFDRFVQAPDGSKRADGSGLGLAISQGIAKLHDGKVGVTNNTGAGCTFVVSLPLDDAPADDSESAPRES
jgi:signal transduction histidine kinase